MITVVTLNPCIDKTIEVADFSLNSTNRALGTRTDIGGKGINVSLVLKTLGTANTNLLIDYTVGNNYISEFLNENDVDTIAVKCSNPLRTNTKIVDITKAEMTEINESGLPVENETVSSLLEKFNTILEKTSILVLCGSVPPGIDNGIYKMMIHKANERGIKTVLDASSLPFALAVDAAPTLVKPNKQELSEYTKCNITTSDEIITAGKTLLEKGIEYVCVSDGENGAYLITKDNVYFSSGTRITVGSPQGAGDSMVGAFAKSMMTSDTPEEMLRSAVSAAQATVMREGTLLCTADDYIRLKNEISVKTLAFN